MPTPDDDAGPRSAAWDAGWDGRALLDRIACEVSQHLRPGGALLIVQSAFADAGRTAASLAAAGLAVRQVAARAVPLGPISRHRLTHLVQLGVVDADAPGDRLLVLEGRMAVAGDAEQVA